MIFQHFNLLASKTVADNVALPLTLAGELSRKDIDLRVAEVPNPRPGDRIEIDGDAFLIQGEPVRDRERLVWTVDLRPV